MRLSHWRPAGPAWGSLRQLQDEMNQVLHRWGGETERQDIDGFPAINVWEDGDALLVEAELPGFDLKDLEIYISGVNQLSIKGQRKANVPPNGVIHRQERGQGSFTRVLSLPTAVDLDKVEARFENGVLFLRLVKHEAAMPRKIKVKG